MKVVVFGLLLLSLLIFGCAGNVAQHGTGTVSSNDISDEDLSVGDLSIDLSEDETALPEQVG